MFQALLHDSFIALPFLGWAILGLLILCVYMIIPRLWPSLIVSIGGLVGLFVLNVKFFDPNLHQFIFNKTALVDSYAQFFNLLGIGIALALVFIMLPGRDQKVSVVKESYDHFPEFLMCLCFSGFGLGVVATAIDLTTLFLGIEVLSIATYCLSGFYTKELRSTEAAFKYLLVGAFSTVIFLYGIAFLYGITGSTHYEEIRLALLEGKNQFLLLSVLFLLAGLAFKFVFIPFHLYAADVYEGVPMPMTGFLATMIKVGVAAAAFRLFRELFQWISLWQSLWLTLCVLSIVLGNISALKQKSIKKLLAFSSIAHAGFLGLALFIAQSPTGSVFPLFSYLLVYSAMTLGLFALLTFIENRENFFYVEDLRGFSRRNMGMSLCLGVFILGLAGIPPLAGFMIKFWVLRALIQEGYLGVAFIAILGSLIGAAYYLRILMVVFISEEEGALFQKISFKDKLFSLRFIIAIMLLITLLGSIRPQLYADWILFTLALK